MTDSNPHPLVCRFGALGDMVLITPLLRHLYERCGLPSDVVTIGKINPLLFRHTPYVRQVYSIDSRSTPYWINHSQKNLVKTLREARHQFTWICETDARSYRILKRAGIDQGNSVSQLNLEKISGEHYCATWLRLGNLSPPGFDAPVLAPTTVDTELFVSEDEVQECRRWLGERGLDPDAPLICIQAGSKRTTRRGNVARSSNTKYWDPKNWASVIDSLSQQLPQAQILLCGVAAEVDMCRMIEAECRTTSLMQTVADDLPLRRLLALLSIAHSCVSVDTGPAHVAAALNCPLVVLFGKADPARFRPLSADSSVQVLTGFASDGSHAGPSIEYVTPQQVVAAWHSATGVG